jgi:hypothetical protein
MNARLFLSALAVAAGLGASGLGRAAPPTADAVGDADSFGKKMVWIGFAQTGTVLLSNDCSLANTGPLGPNDRCQVLVSGSNTYSYPDLGSISLPGNSAGTFICHWASPGINYVLSYPTPTGPGSGPPLFRARATYRIESELLQDPSLINPMTHLPFDGGIDVTVPITFEKHQPAGTASDGRAVYGTRACIGGLVTKASLISDYGLTEQQAKKFFEKPLTIRVGVSGQARWVSEASIQISTRFTTDEK